jgi:hypothetical protein
VLISSRGCISERLELGEIVMDGHVALRCVAELGIEGNGADLFVVVEETFDGVHYQSCRRAWAMMMLKFLGDMGP